MSKSAQLIIGTALIVVITFCITIYSGVQTGRWSLFKGLSEAREALKELPKEINGWVVTGEDQQLDTETITILQIQDGYIARSYRNTKTQSVVHMVLMVGPTGRVVVHTPEICFGGKDYQKEENRVSVTIPVILQDSPDESEDTFWKVDFINRGLKRDRISFYYSVSLGKSWIATENPRSTFQFYRYAYKIQIQSLVDS
ncbi:MAG: EpsI family protein, partial [Planctomycetaceae bacterium]|nr:EpsI family protein [Planctomycetaceae bacterium]